MLTKTVHCDGSSLGWSKYTHSLRDRDRVMWLMSPAWALKLLEACGGLISLMGSWRKLQIRQVGLARAIHRTEQTERSKASSLKYGPQFLFWKWVQLAPDPGLCRQLVSKAPEVSSG